MDGQQRDGLLRDGWKDNNRADGRMVGHKWSGWMDGQTTDGATNVQADGAQTQAKNVNLAGALQGHSQIKTNSRP